MGSGKKKEFLVDISSLSFLLSKDVTNTSLKEPEALVSLAGTFSLSRRLCAPMLASVCAHAMCYKGLHTPLTRTRPSDHEVHI
jgi:hypothetical protein